jgi:hypothetical protein
MITINKGQANEVVLTLNEKLTISNASFVFVFTNDITGASVTFTADDTSTAIERYNQFTITESSSQDVYNGTITLVNQGNWSYKVYETPTASPIDLSDLGAELESGKVNVIGTSSVTYTTFDNNYVTDNTIFE